jgi:hypothetical protein
MPLTKTTLEFTIGQSDAGRTITVPVDSLIIAGWTGRDVAAMEAHIVELEKMGVSRPKKTPVFYRVSAALLTQAPEIEVPGNTSSGEVEPVIFSTPDGLWLGLGSDHTDRKVETIGITISKQLCAKPIGKALWPFAEIAEHWDDLIVRSWATQNGRRRLYQEGTLAKMRFPKDLLARYGGEGYVLPAGFAMFCGTLAVHGEIGPAEIFEMEIEDPVFERKISHQYRTTVLPIEG